MSQILGILGRNPMTLAGTDAQVQKERCGRCGKMSPMTAAFCPRCGVRLRDVSALLQAEILDAEPVVPPPPPPLPTGSWEVLDPPPLRPSPVIPVIPKAPRPLSFAPPAPSWSAPRSF